MPTARVSVLLVVLSGILFGTAGTAQALGPSDTTPLGLGILRIQIGAVALLVAMPFLGGSPRRLLHLWRQPAILITSISAAVYQLCFFAGVLQVGVALGTLVAVGTEPIFAGLLGWRILRHRPTPGWLAATLVCVAGLVLRSVGSLSGAGEAVGAAVGSAPVTGLLLALGAGLCSAGYTVAAKRQLDLGATALEVPTASFVLGGVLLLPILAGQPLGWVAAPSGAALAVYLGVATMAIANVLLTRAIHGLTPGPVATLMLTDPVVATLLGVVVLGERLDLLAALGLLLVCGGLMAQGILAARGSPDDQEPVPVL
ncbi:MAG: EamA family transporter [Chloroflexota bacterium]